MCGIIGYVGSHDPKGILLEGLKRLEYRGYDSAGIAILEGNKVELFRSEGKIRNLEEKVGSRIFKGTLGIGHTRWATHGAPTEKNAHPHQAGSVTLVHNGIIENFMELKKEIVSKGRTVKTETDTEIVAHLLEGEILNGCKLEEALLKVLPKLRGSYAFVIFSDKEPDLMIGVRNGAPLLVGVGERENFLASDVQAILDRTKRVVYLEDSQYAVCRSGGYTIKSSDGKTIQPTVSVINWNADQLDKAGYPHFMLKEIHEQPQAIAQTIQGNIDYQQGVVFIPKLSKEAGWLKKIKRISIAACGTAKYAGLVGKYYLERFVRVPVEIDFASEFRYRDPLLEDTLLILISQSGETADTLAALREGKSKKAKTLSICNVRDSTLARESDIVLYTDAGPEIGVCSTKAFTTQLAMLYMFSIHLGLLRGNLSKEQGVELTEELLRLPILMERTLSVEGNVKAMMHDTRSCNSFFYIGRGIQYPVALEGALKLKEISYLHAEGYPAGELKHGPIALIDESVITVVLAPKTREYSTFGHVGAEQTLFEKVMSNVQEIKARKGQIVGIGSREDEVLSRECKHFVGIPTATWAVNPILLAVPIQLFAYYSALQLGTDIDMPRNLAKSVTVE